MRRKGIEFKPVVTDVSGDCSTCPLFDMTSDARDRCGHPNGKGLRIRVDDGIPKDCPARTEPLVEIRVA